MTPNRRKRLLKTKTKENIHYPLGRALVTQDDLRGLTAALEVSDTE